MRRLMPNLISGDPASLRAAADRGTAVLADMAWGAGFGGATAGRHLHIIALKISYFARRHGPPPPEVPLSHIGLWEDAVSACVVERMIGLPSLAQWQRLGFLTMEEEQPEATVPF